MNYLMLGIFSIFTNIMLVVAVSMKGVHSRSKNSVMVQNIPLEIFDRTVNFSDRSGILVGPKTPIYLLRSRLPNFNQHNTGVRKRNRRYIKEKIIPIPDIVYPEILIIVDYHLYKNYNRRTIIPYLLSFWDQVDSIFSSLENPKFKLSIAGIIIAQDNSVFESFIPSKSSEIDYKDAKKNMNLWLSRAREAIPFESYDTYVIMTRTRNKESGNKRILGISGIQTACVTPESNHDLGGIIFTPGGIQGTRTAGHELGHIFGAEHDKPDCGKSYLMATFDGNPTDWSQCSINSFHESLK
ncbi:hypothetical protein KQX54_006453 [Cotesia glomerata]|uniref:Peptidase M12B domain-containing protein n=2 Tax=Cotesia glomerata TaxID=32391 RepID=A0AAV7HW10_COTGL|nr:hypothetical protein KQX54_006453 [Cotesia glomerata]